MVYENSASKLLTAVAANGNAKTSVLATAAGYHMTDKIALISPPFPSLFPTAIPTFSFALVKLPVQPGQKEF